MPGFREVIRRCRARFGRQRRQIVSGHRIGAPVDIERLICPLRYDIRIRIDFILLLRDEWARYQDDLDHFLSDPQSRAYFAWFREVACARFHPEIYPHPELVWRRFLQRVHATAQLWRSIAQDGYDRSKPIRLASGRSIQAVNGKMIASSTFAGDGCHRIACLYLTGQTRLEPEDYEVEVRRRFEPLDNTAILMRTLPLDRTTYLRFLSQFYCGGAACDSPDQILRHVAADKPQLLSELESVLAFDLPRLGAHAQPSH